MIYATYTEGATNSRWWQLKYVLIFTPYLGRFSNLTVAYFSVLPPTRILCHETSTYVMLHGATIPKGGTRRSRLHLHLRSAPTIYGPRWSSMATCETEGSGEKYHAGRCCFFFFVCVCVGCWQKMKKHVLVVTV